MNYFLSLAVIVLIIFFGTILAGMIAKNNELVQQIRDLLGRV